MVNYKRLPARALSRFRPLRCAENRSCRSGPALRQIDVNDDIALWDDAFQSRWERDQVWMDGDVSASNLLVLDGELHAVIDFGCAAVGDPACDLVIAWTFLAQRDRQIFREVLGMDDATWKRGNAWALWKALISVGEELARTDSVDAIGSTAGASALSIWCPCYSTIPTDHLDPKDRCHNARSAHPPRDCWRSCGYVPSPEKRR